MFYNDLIGIRNTNLSHITTGYMYNSPSANIVRVDEVYKGTIASSVFNFANVTKYGLVDNTLTSVFEDFRGPSVFRGYVNSNFPLIIGSFLVDMEAVFTGLVDRSLISGQLSSVCSHSSTQ